MDIPEAFAEQLVADFLTAHPEVAVECNGRAAVEPKQVFLPGRIEGARPSNAGDRALVLRPDVEEDDLAAIEHCLEFGSVQLLYLRWLVRVAVSPGAHENNEPRSTRLLRPIIF